MDNAGGMHNYSSPIVQSCGMVAQPPPPAHITNRKVQGDPTEFYSVFHMRFERSHSIFSTGLSKRNGAKLRELS